MNNSPRILLAFMVFTVLPLTACALSEGPVEGRVLEEGTGKPIPNAIVIIRWQGYVSSLADTQDVCVHVDTAMTDEQGKYRFPMWSKSSKVGPVFDVKPIVTAYKPDYELSQEYFDKQTYRKNIYPLKLFTGTREQRLEYLERIARSSGCHAAGESEKNLYPLYEALYYEAKANAAKEEDLHWYREAAAAIAVGISDQLTHAENEERIEQFLGEHLK